MERQSILDYFIENAEQYGSTTAALVKRNGAYKPVTWHAMAQQAQQIATGLMAVGIQTQDRVAILAQSSLEWVVLDMAILSTGAITVPIYPSNLPDECQFILENSGTVVVFAEDVVQVNKLLQVQKQLPKVRHVVQISGQVVDSHNGFIISLDDLQNKAPVDLALLAKRRQQVTKESILTVIYTSGTTGRPKGVVLTHGNMLYVADAIEQIDIVRQDDVQLLFLPLAHAFAKVLEIAWLSTRHVLAFAESMHTLKDNLQEVQPTLMAGVPRVYEKFYSAVLQQGSTAGGAAGKLFNRAVALSQKIADAQDNHTKVSWLDTLQFELLKAVVLRKVHQGLHKTLGGRMRVMVSGGAPLSSKIGWFFQHVGFTLVEGFGLTETSAATCINRLDNNRIGSVGLPLPGTEVSLAEDGELLIKGGGVMHGYWQDQKATDEVFRDEWFCTGDIAKIDTKGIVRIVDRKKDIIVTAGGKNVAPQNIENILKTYKIISQAVVHGDKRSYLTALLTLDADVLAHMAKEQQLGTTSYAELTQHSVVLNAVQQVLDTLNAQLPRYETIKKFKILDHDFSQESGELTPSLKVKRKLVNQRYKAIFDGFYSETYG